MIKCIVVDDEPIAQDIIASYIEKMDFLTLVGKADNGLQAMSLLGSQEVDLMFLDIEMPMLNGIDFLETLKNPPMVIFTTAYQEYALKGYEYNAVDYLLKPIALDRFIKAVNNAKERMTTPTAVVVNTNDNKDFFFVKADSEMVKVIIKDILFVEGLKDYVKIFLADKKIVTLSTMKSMSELLEPQGFLRIHRSFIVNLNKIDAIVGGTIRIGEHNVYIGKSYKKEVGEILKQRLF